jgi:hypothetical protein
MIMDIQELANKWTVNPEKLKQDYDELKEKHETFTKLIADKFMEMNRKMMKLQVERDEALKLAEERLDLLTEVDEASGKIESQIEELQEQLAFEKSRVQIRLEPSRLEIAAMLLGAQPPPQAGSFSGQAEHALRRADALIAAAKEVAK